MEFLSSNKTIYRLGRTILQGVIGVIVAYIDVLVGVMSIPTELRPMIVALVMAILSPVMSELGKKNSTELEPGWHEMTEEGAYDLVDNCEELEEEIEPYEEADDDE